MSITRERLERFVARRNGAEFRNTLQTLCDAHACGFQLRDLGKPALIEGAVTWKTPIGIVREISGQWSYEPAGK